MKRSIVLTLVFTVIGAALLFGNTGDCPAGDCTANCIETCVYGCEAQNCSTESCDVSNCHNNCGFSLADCLTSCTSGCLNWCQSEACSSICQNCGEEVCSECAAIPIGGSGCIGVGEKTEERDLIAGEDYTDFNLIVTDYYTERNGSHKVKTSFSVQMKKSFSDISLLLDFKDGNGNTVGTRTLEKGSVNFFDGYTYEVLFTLTEPYAEDFYYSVRSFRGTPNS